MRLGAIRYTERWLCYFDLLGFSRVVNDHEIDEIIPTYEEVIYEIEALAGDRAHLPLSYSWFSDTFILFSRHGTDKEFAAIEQAGRLFFQKLILKDIPVRGALTYGRLYSLVAKNIFVGPALIDAYKYGEAQDWIGFILTPAVYRRCRHTILDLDRRLNYRPLQTTDVLRGMSPEHVYACVLNHPRADGPNLYLQHLRKMRDLAEPTYRKKYERTEQFVLHHERAAVPPAGSAPPVVDSES